MGRRVPSVALLVGVLLLGACGSDSPSGVRESATPSTTAGSPSTTLGTAPTTAAATTTVRPATTTSSPRSAAAGCAVARQPPPPGRVAANFATALAFTPDGRLFFAERRGTVRVLQDGEVRAFAAVPTVTTEAGGGYSERGLLGLAVSPTFAADRFVYAFYSAANRTGQVVMRWTDCGGESRDPTVLIELPAGATCCHKGGRIAFGPDGKLYVTLGDQHTPSAAADTSDRRGKVLRYNPDGSVPADNPFGAGNPVWASGFRNPFGIAVSPAGRVAVTSNGPSGDAGSPPTGHDIVITDVTRAAPTNGCRATATASPSGAPPVTAPSLRGAARPRPSCRPGSRSSTGPGRRPMPTSSSSAPSTRA